MLLMFSCRKQSHLVFICFQITADDHTNAFALLQDLNSKANGVINSVEGLLGKVKQDKLNTAKVWTFRYIFLNILLHNLW